MYQLLPAFFNSPVGVVATGVRRITDGACIPFDPANTCYQEYQEWIALGNQPLPADEATQ